MIDLTPKRKYRRRVSELEEKLRDVNRLQSRFLGALAEEDVRTAARILSRVHGEPPRTVREQALALGARLHEAAAEERGRTT